jgi:hypothetical protein
MTLTISGIQFRITFCLKMKSMCCSQSLSGVNSFDTCTQDFKMIIDC